MNNFITSKAETTTGKKMPVAPVDNSAKAKVFGFIKKHPGDNEVVKFGKNVVSGGKNIVDGGGKKIVGTLPKVDGSVGKTLRMMDVTKLKLGSSNVPNVDRNVNVNNSNKLEFLKRYQSNKIEHFNGITYNNFYDLVYLILIVIIMYMIYLQWK